MGKGKLIVLESCDGAGKSTQIKQITKYFEEKNLKYDFLHFPKYGHNEFSEVIAKFLQGEFGGVDDVDPYFVANIYAMDRFLFLPELKKMLEENDVVLLDRYVFSGMAFQAAKYINKDKQEEIIDWIDKFEFDFLDLPYPDLTIFLNVPMEVIKQRLINNREGADREYLEGKEDIHEADLEFQARVNQVYFDLEVDSRNYHIVHCAEDNGRVFPPKELFETYKNLLEEIL